MSNVKPDDVEASKTCLVLYTDGGARPNPGFAGWGLHGYSYPLVDTDKRKKKKLVTGVPTKVGYYVDQKVKDDDVVRPERIYEFAGGISTQGTNNQGEMTATLNGLQLALAENAHSVNIISDSEYTGKGIREGIPKWKKDDWKTKTGEDRPNKDIWIKLDSVVQQLKDRGTQVEISWIKGHNGHKGNSEADSQATKGVYLAKKQDFTPVCNTYEFADYDKSNHGISPLAFTTRWFYNSEREDFFERNPEGFRVYYLGRQPDDKEYYGKPTPDVTFSVMWSKAGEPILDKLFNYSQRHLPNPKGNLCVGNLQRIKLASQHRDLVGDAQPVYDLRDGVYLVNTSDEVVLEVRNPPGISYRVMECLHSVETILREAYHGRTSEQLRFQDVTSTFFTEKEVKGKKVYEVRKDITPITKYVDVMVDYPGAVKPVKTRLTLELDCPSRSVFNAIKGEEPQVLLFISKEGSGGYRYGTIIKTNTDWSATASVHANLRVLSLEELGRK